MRIFAFLVLIAAIVTVVVLLIPGGPPATPGNGPLPPPRGDELRLLFTYGSEKEAWLKEATASFNAKAELVDGKRITVEALPMGSGECIDEVLDGSRQPHLISPASGVFLALGNARSQAASGKDLIGASENLVLSPVVIAMWKPMAEALGWPAKPIGWGDVLALAREPQGWAAKGHAEWGRFRFGHTHPESSNSGLIALLAQGYAATGKTSGLTSADLATPEVAAYVGGIQRAIVHYGKSTGFFANRLASAGPGYLSAAVVYESNVIESYARADNTFPPLVAIYPKEGTFWSDHPVGVVERPWVTPAHRTAARRYIDFLLAQPQQEAALRMGFRPAAVNLAVAAPIDAAHGVDPKQPTTTLPVPGAGVCDAALRLWRANKKRSEICLVLDTSGSMSEEGKMPAARTGAQALVGLLGDEDHLSLMPFSSAPNWVARDLVVKDDRAKLQAQIGGLYPNGGTALYDAIEAGWTALKDRAGGERIVAVVVLTDGQDTNSKLKLDDLITRIGGPEGGAVRVFAIGYGKGADMQVLKRIADATQGRAYAGDPRTITSVFKDISTFF